MGAKVIAFRDDGWMSPNTDYRMWDHLCRAYGAELQMVSSWDDAEYPKGFDVILVDQLGDDVLGSFVHPRNGVYLFGRTSMNLPSIMDGDHVLQIVTPNPISMFGVSAAAIVLEDRER